MRGGDEIGTTKTKEMTTMTKSAVENQDDDDSDGTGRRRQLCNNFAGTKPSPF